MPKLKKNIEKNLILLLECFFLIFLLFLTAFNLNSALPERKVLGISTQELNTSDQEKDYLNQIILENPTYFDALIEVTKLELIEGNIKKAEKYYNLAKTINPNSKELRQISGELKNK